MSDIGIQGVLSQIRALREQSALPPAQAVKPAAGGGFMEAIGKAIEGVNKTQGEAAKLSDAFERGDRGTSLAEVMLAMQKSSVAFKAVTEVRNRLVQAYQDIQNMPI